MNLRRTMPLAPLVAVLATLAGQPVMAEPTRGLAEVAYQQRVVHVRFDDLDLTRAAGQQAFQSRLAVAARKVCRVDNRRNAMQRPMMKRCEQQAVSNALAQLDGGHGHQHIVGSSRPNPRVPAIDPH